MQKAWVLTEEGSSWDLVSENDLWEGEDANSNSDQEDYVLVKQEDIVEGIACFMAAYLLSLKQTKVCYQFSLLIFQTLYRTHQFTLNCVTLLL